jgi:hypothetical protein
MLKTILATVAGFVVFFAFAYGVGFAMRASWPEYAAVADALTFTLPMLIARLSIGVVATLVAGRVAAAIAVKPTAAAIAAGISLVVFFVPVHIRLWDKFPVWYHLFFLISLIPLSFAGSRIARSSTGERTSAVAT